MSDAPILLHTNFILHDGYGCRGQSPLGTRLIVHPRDICIVASLHSMAVCSHLPGRQVLRSLTVPGAGSERGGVAASLARTTSTLSKLCEEWPKHGNADAENGEVGFEDEEKDGRRHGTGDVHG